MHSSSSLNLNPLGT
jgi:hypothetical protein